MSLLKDKHAAQVPALRDEVKALLAAHGETKISEVTVGQAWRHARRAWHDLRDLARHP